MKFDVNDEFRDICKSILSENKLDADWVLIESDDMFQSEHFCGGYDSTEHAFCFSYYDDSGKEYWFQISLKEIPNIVNNLISNINIRLPSN